MLDISRKILYNISYTNTTKLKKSKLKIEKIFSVDF